MQTTVQTFSSLNITIGEENCGFVGKQMEMQEVIGQEIVILDYKIKPSKYAEKYDNDKCLWLQIEVDGKKWVVFTGSRYLQMQIEQVKKDQLPRRTVIKRQPNKSLMFT